MQQLHTAPTLTQKLRQHKEENDPKYKSNLKISNGANSSEWQCKKN